MEILNYSFDGEGMQRVFENEKWTVGIKNWKPANDITGINNLERHNKTDELFVLVAGSCTLIYANEVEGMQRVFENEKWTVGIKNWKPANDITGINNLERHNKTDELFVLVAGSCTLIYANEVEGGLDIKAVKMEPNKVYNIPATLWHNTVTCKDTKMILIEDSNTSMDNSDILDLKEDQIAAIKALV